MATKAPDYSSIMFKLLEKTKSGKVEWEEDPPFERFRTQLAEGFSFSIGREISRGDTTYSLFMKDSDGNCILNLQLSDDPETMTRRRTEYDTLSELYDVARRKVLRVDEKVERVSEILERI